MWNNMICTVWRIVQLTVLSYSIFDSTIIIGYFCQDDETPLIWAVAGNHVDAVEMLLEAGADKEAIDRVSKRMWICAQVYVYTRLCVRVYLLLLQITLCMKKRIINFSFLCSLVISDLIFLMFSSIYSTLSLYSM